MLKWTHHILKDFPPGVSHFWIACDPDGILLDEMLLRGLRDNGFEVIPFRDSISFRVEYEERFRSRRISTDKNFSNAVILHLLESNSDNIPYDYLQIGKVANINLGDLFHKLSYGVIRHLNQRYYERLFVAHNKLRTQHLDDRSTSDFILSEVFHFSPNMISTIEDFWREAFRLYLNGIELPIFLARHVASRIEHFAATDLPVAKLLSSTHYFVSTVQEAWRQFLFQLGVLRKRESKGIIPVTIHPVPIPFEHPDITSFVCTMFTEGVLHPIDVEQYPRSIPTSLRIGMVHSRTNFANLVSDGVGTLTKNIPSIDSSYRDWVNFAKRLGEIIFRFNNLDANCIVQTSSSLDALRRDADCRLLCWIQSRYATLPSLPPAFGPVMVHHIPRYLALQRSGGEDRTALIVIDGMAMDQWVQIRDYLMSVIPGFSADESGCFAWLPTITSVSRQALFSGLKPREFSESIETTGKEKSLWCTFWEDNGLLKSSVVYRRGLKRSDQLHELEECVSHDSVKVAGIVVSMIDEIIHGAKLGKRGVAGQILTWCETGFVENLIRILTNHRYQVYISSDHGNVEAKGVGRVSQGDLSSMKGERLRIYRSEILTSSFPHSIDSFRVHNTGLPANYFPVYAGKRGAFVPIDEQIVAHGGASIEEIIVPFAKITIKKADQ